MLNLGLFNVVRRLGEVKAPTLVITGQNDTTVDPQRQKVLVNNIPGARQVIIPGAGHAVSIDQPVTIQPGLDGIFTFLKKSGTIRCRDFRL